ncbi:MAG: KH domain-containing protein [Eubacteriales bacterium]
MLDLSQLLSDLARAIVDQPEEVSVTEETEGDAVLLTLHVAESDMGKIIGRHGKIAKSIRMVMKAAANSINKSVTVEIR